MALHTWVDDQIIAGDIQLFHPPDAGRVFDECHTFLAVLVSERFALLHARQHAIELE